MMGCSSFLPPEYCFAVKHPFFIPYDCMQISLFLTFSGSDAYFLGDQTGAQLASTAIMTALNDYATGLSIIGLPDGDGSLIITPYAEPYVFHFSSEAVEYEGGLWANLLNIDFIPKAWSPADDNDRYFHSFATFTLQGSGPPSPGVPIPATLGLFGLGLVGLGIGRRKRKLPC